MKRTKLIASLAAVLSASYSLEASTYSEEFLQWKEQTMTSYQQYKDERDEAFTNFLKKQWKEVDTKEGEIRDATPKPADIPIAQPKPTVIKDPLPLVQLPTQVKPPKEKPVSERSRAELPRAELPRAELPRAELPQAEMPTTEVPQIKEPPVIHPEVEKPLADLPTIDFPVAEAPSSTEPIIVKEPTSDKVPSKALPEPFAPPIVEVPKVHTPPVAVKKPKEKQKPKYTGKKYTFDFFGRKTTVYADKNLAKGLGYTYNSKTIAKGWSDLSLAEYDSVLEQLSTISKEHNLGDWGRVQLAFAFTKKLYPSNLNNQSFASWFLLVKQDYQARLAYNDKGIYLLIPAEQSLYEVTFFTFGGKRFYAVSPDGKSRDLGRVFTYDGEYPRAIEPVSMKDHLAFSDETNYKQRNFKFTFQKQKHQITLNVNPSRVNYLSSYPQMDINEYFVSPVDLVTANDALDHFRPLLEGKSELEAVNLLLRFVQTSFEYQTDDQQFGFENYLFAEETLTMPASDCEDRSVLFAWLVKELLGLDVIGLDYPGHIAAAVLFSKPVPGDKVAWNGKKYTVTDPTYINANSGMTMPEVSAHKPKVVAIQ